jgi:hypothetical protein
MFVYTNNHYPNDQIVWKTDLLQHLPPHLSRIVSKSIQDEEVEPPPFHMKKKFDNIYSNCLPNDAVKIVPFHVESHIFQIISNIRR